MAPGSGCRSTVAGELGFDLSLRAFMNPNLQSSNCYPFKLDGALCPLLNDGELLGAFYAEESLRHGIKAFCKKTNWPGKPPVPFALGAEKLQELMVSLFNSPAARAVLQKLSEADRATYLDNAIWQWFGVTNTKLAERMAKCCEDIKERIFLRIEPLQKFLGEFQKEQPDEKAVAAVACAVLAFAMLQPDDRFAFGDAFLAVFPEYTKPYCG